MQQKTANKTIIIKVGTNLLTTENNQLDLNYLRGLVDQIVHILKENPTLNVALVTSGAITCGAAEINIATDNIPSRQAAASVGQFLLMKEYDLFFRHHGYNISQILLTKDGLEPSERKNNARNTIDTLFSYGVIPIINENDTVSTDEIGTDFGDNDQLSARVAKLIDAFELIILTDTQGVYTANPNTDSNAQLLNTIDTITDDILNMASDNTGSKGRGGMYSKLLAAKRASDDGIRVVIAPGRQANVLIDIFNGVPHGTRILAKGERS